MWKLFVYLSPFHTLPIFEAQLCYSSSGVRRQWGSAGTPAAGAEPDQEGWRVRGALQFAPGADKQLEKAPGHREGAVQSERDHVQTECRFYRSSGRC